MLSKLIRSNIFPPIVINATGFTVEFSWIESNAYLTHIYIFNEIIANHVVGCCRNWLAGRSIARNITDSIEKSRRTVLVLSNAYAQSHWCELELAMAQHKILAKKT